MNDHRDWKALRDELRHARGRRFWRSLDELAGAPAFDELLAREFPQGAEAWDDAVGRRRFLKLSAASLALAGLSACTRQPLETIVPYVEAPENIVPGKPLYFATSTTLRGVASGVLVESHMGRPTKIEGNPQHPASLGATDVASQASVLGLYDPDRSQVVVNAGRIGTWEGFRSELDRVLDRQRRRMGAGLRILTGTVTSPTMERQLRDLLEVFPRARWHVWESVPRDSIRQGARMAFGTDLEPVYRFEGADVVLSLDADFLAPGPGHLVYTREFTARRRPSDSHQPNRLYAVEPTLSLTGAMADHRLALSPGKTHALAAAVARRLGVDVRGFAAADVPADFVDAVVSDLAAHRGRGLVLAGEHAPPELHALTHAVNAALGNVGATVELIDPIEVLPTDHPGSVASLERLAEDMDGGRVELLMMIGVNPVYDAPADLDFAARLANVDFRAHLGPYADETAELCHWHVPEAHELESWSDARAYDGTVSLSQPLIEPLYRGRTPYELLSVMAGTPSRSSYDILRDGLRELLPEGASDFERFWKQSVHDGFIAGSAFEPRDVSLVAQTIALPESASSGGGAIEAIFRPDPTVFDGRFANNGWLQETPKPFTKLTWDNAALVAPKTAERLGLDNEDRVSLTLGERTVPAPVWIAPGQAEDVVTLHLGYGRRRAGRAGDGAGFDAQRLRTSDGFWAASGLAIEPIGESYPLACTQDHQSMEGRALVREASFEELREHPHFAHEGHHEPAVDESLYPPPYGEGDYAWGMSIDLSTCTGCNACVVACQAENNIPVVGKGEVRNAREMHWIRIDCYFEGEPDNPRVHHQPVNCMHCENAPCEVVCPVSATVHTPEGLNAMVYNRCVGTRYCSNNCPYKVRRFNFLLYSDFETPVLASLNNPDVTVRSRGVMEKCTYCVQRINGARIEAKKEDRRIGDGEVVTACQQVCPAEAITFGDIDDAESRVARDKAEPRSYGILAELGTRPRTTYLAKLRNPNPALEGSSDGEDAR